jgi:hypothetical protein
MSQEQLLQQQQHHQQDGRQYYTHEPQMRLRLLLSTLKHAADDGVTLDAIGDSLCGTETYHTMAQQLSQSCLTVQALEDLVRQEASADTDPLPPEADAVLSVTGQRGEYDTYNSIRIGNAGDCIVITGRRADASLHVHMTFGGQRIWCKVSRPLAGATHIANPFAHNKLLQFMQRHRLPFLPLWSSINPVRQSHPSCKCATNVEGPIKTIKEFAEERNKHLQYALARIAGCPNGRGWEEDGYLVSEALRFRDSNAVSATGSTYRRMLIGMQDGLIQPADALTLEDGRADAPAHWSRHGVQSDLQQRCREWLQMLQLHGDNDREIEAALYTAVPGAPGASSLAAVFALVFSNSNNSSSGDVGTIFQQSGLQSIKLLASTAPSTKRTMPVLHELAAQAYGIWFDACSSLLRQAGVQTSGAMRATDQRALLSAAAVEAAATLRLQQLVAAPPGLADASSTAPDQRPSKRIKTGCCACGYGKASAKCAHKAANGTAMCARCCQVAQAQGRGRCSVHNSLTSTQQQQQQQQQLLLQQQHVLWALPAQVFAAHQLGGAALLRP